MMKRNPLTQIAIRTLDLSQPLVAVTDIASYPRVKIFVTWSGRMIGSFEIENQRQPVEVAQLRQAIAEHLPFKVLDPEGNSSEDLLGHQVVKTLANTYLAEHQVEEVTSRVVDLSMPLRPFANELKHQQVEIPVLWKEKYLGTVRVASRGEPISVTQLREATAKSLGLELLKPDLGPTHTAVLAGVVTALAQHYHPAAKSEQASHESLSPSVSVSIILATLDRPDDLRNCLRSLMAQQSPRRIEIVVIDNHPASGLTPPVVAEFPGVVLVNEARRGLAYARNAGFTACTGDIAIATDDDVVMPPDWIERLVAPFARKDVMIVTGNVLPLELETPAQQFFELYGGLGRGFTRVEVGGDWFEAHRFFSVPTWRLGATANAAFRATIFTHPEIGLMDETLGPGMPSGVGEDTYLFYKVLKAGYTIIYEPEAYVWHKHRQTVPALRRQLYNYSKGGVAYHLTLVYNDGDLRGLVRIFCELPMVYVWRFKQWVSGQSAFPMSLILLEMWGNFAGFGAFFQSRRRVKREGRSAAYVPVAERRTAELQSPAF